jgi:hypothetical protein
VLVELSVMEQRYRAVLEAEAGCPVTEVAGSQVQKAVSGRRLWSWAGSLRPMTYWLLV